MAYVSHARLEHHHQHFARMTLTQAIDTQSSCDNSKYILVHGKMGFVVQVSWII